ncbi:putative Endonuclease/Exonuclease/phosphatase [Candidatus Nanopelagicus abundans]|uniref:Putative Endonuclease/Exonuclease/phosphatase n=1 Tax=Candidatus Nanopelagicus abundans TaxID=1884916 RepID=A0A249L5D2_9ACTN|nr:endonuclease/exonuclease/phosphatase family protein [Candidatus Nanopelagicus abundans]ASY24227.1 putative Endonuclease/Exonuclease/phosphatase [Candidatus Nanopelagicus abundans]
MVVAPAQKMRVISWNLLHGQVIPPLAEQDWQQNLISSAKDVAKHFQPDFISLQEVDYLQPRSGNINQTKLIAESMGLKYWYYLPALLGTPGSRWQKVKNLEPGIISQNTNNPSPNTSYGIGFATSVPIKKIYTKALGRSIIGMPLLIPKDNGKGARFIYVKDEPRVALIAELENGLTIATTHLSFVPFVNVFQLNRLIIALKKLSGVPVLVGDLNLPANIPSKLSGFKSVISQSTYPSWKPKIQFDYIMVANNQEVQATPFSTIKPNISDHVPIGVELNF